MLRKFLATAVGKAVGMVAGVALLLAILFGGWKLLGAWDEYQDLKQTKDEKNAEVHGAAADSLRNEGALLDATKVAPARAAYARYSTSSNVRANPVAVAVADTCQVLVNSLDARLVVAKSEAEQRSQQVRDLQAAGKPRIPRGIPYIDPIYTWSSKNGGRGVPGVRAGVDYRLLPHASLKLEGSYEAPPAGENRAEFRATVGAHFTLR